MDFEWAKPYPNVHKICSSFQLTELSNPIKFYYKPVPEYIQDGPQCGLVALAMLQGTPTKESVNSLLEIAKSRNFTYNGEIFSVSYMAELAAECLPKNLRVEVHSGNLNSEKTRNVLLSGGVMLVPYDCEKDHTPSLKNGHKAHWAVITGAVQTCDEFFVLARHGKAKNVAIWKLNNLSDSNAQLNEFCPDRKFHDIAYKLPNEGIGGPLGLKSKAVFIYGID